MLVQYNILQGYRGQKKKKEVKLITPFIFKLIFSHKAYYISRQDWRLPKKWVDAFCRWSEAVWSTTDHRRLNHGLPGAVWHSSAQGVLPLSSRSLTGHLTKGAVATGGSDTTRVRNEATECSSHLKRKENKNACLRSSRSMYLSIVYNTLDFNIWWSSTHQSLHHTISSFHTWQQHLSYQFYSSRHLLSYK